MPPRTRIPKLPQLLEKKIYKTGQTRGADDDVIYQNRVGRNGTVLIPYNFAELCGLPSKQTYQNGFIVLISPREYFSNSNINLELSRYGLALGVNALVFYETREEWDKYNPEELGWSPAMNRTNPLGGEYVSRVPATTSTVNGSKINRGFTSTSKKGAGIRVYEYASSTDIEGCRLQLEAIFWMCRDSLEVAAENQMSIEGAELRKKDNFLKCQQQGLLDLSRLRDARIINSKGFSICPLCLGELSGNGFLNRMAQAEGREVPDLTITQLNLFHIEELRLGVLNHKPYNLGWGHHHCNVVVKDSGINETLDWMYEVIERNINEGYLAPANRPI